MHLSVDVPPTEYRTATKVRWSSLFWSKTVPDTQTLLYKICWLFWAQSSKGQTSPAAYRREQIFWVMFKVKLKLKVSIYFLNKCSSLHNSLVYGTLFQKKKNPIDSQWIKWHLALHFFLIEINFTLQKWATNDISYWLQKSRYWNFDLTYLKTNDPIKPALLTPIIQGSHIKTTASRSLNSWIPGKHCCLTPLSVHLWELKLFKCAITILCLSSSISLYFIVHNL